MSEQEEVFSGNRSKITFDGSRYRGFIMDKEIFCLGSRETAFKRLQSELGDACDELTDDFNEINETDTESTSDDE